MSFKLIINSSNPPTDTLIVTEFIKSENGSQIDIEWRKDWKDKGNLKLINQDGTILAENNNDVNRYFARTIHTDLYGGIDVCNRTEVDHWLSYVIGSLQQSPLEETSLRYLDCTLIVNTWLVAKKLTLADISVFTTLFNKQYIEKFEKQYTSVSRWYKQMLSVPAVAKALAVVTKNTTTIHNTNRLEYVTEKLQGTRKQEGKFVHLPGAEMGKVVVRFPPEASGYLHIGHAKAALLNQYYADAFQGQLIMRFDDTNPAKETVEFEQAILEDISMLEIKPDRFTHTSDYFDIMLQYCTKLIKEGKAYVDDTSAQLMKEQRDQKIMSVNRNNSTEQNLKLWNEMQKGTPKGQECCVRAKIDYKSVNGCLRDPTIYRYKSETHPRTGSKYMVYPTYDFACPIVDAIENVTHTLRTTEYHDRDAQFYWFIDALGLRKPYIWEYSRLNMTNTVLSKRKLTWFVSEGLVDGWDDPRFPTVRGILRRGMTVEGLKQFIIAQGSSKSVVFMEWDKIWTFNKKVIDPIAHRYTALDQDKLVPVTVMDAKEEWLTVPNHPKDPSKGTKNVRITSTIFIEKNDAEALVEGQNTTFINWGNLLIEKIYRNNDKIEGIDAKLNLQDKNYKNTLKITWLATETNKENAEDSEHNDLIPCYAVYFDHIISKPVLGKDEDFKDFVAKNTRTEIQMLGESELKRVKHGEIIQLQRKGFFRCDVPYAPTSHFSSRVQPLILYHIPDGHATNSNVHVPTNNVQDCKLLKSVNSKLTSDINKLSNDIKRQHDIIEKLKNSMDQEEKVLLNLENKFESLTGQHWQAEKVAIKTIDVSNDNEIAAKIQKQADKVRDLKKSKADKKIVNLEVKILLDLKANYKTTTGQDWKPQILTIQENSLKSADDISVAIQKQGDKVRELKCSKADKKIIDQEVKTLLDLKANYEAATGQNWKPQNLDAKIENTKTASDISMQIQEQGDKVRELKISKADKRVIDEEVKILLDLKSSYKTATGQDWKPHNIVVETGTVKNADEIFIEIQKQGDKVRELKRLKADKKIIDEEVKVLLQLKSSYKTVTGQDWKPTKQEVMLKKKQSGHNAPPVRNYGRQSIKGSTDKDTDAIKSGTRLGLEVKKDENFYDWYSQVITKSGMIEYYDVSGCYILRPWSYAVWKIIMRYIDDALHELGVENTYFPIFVSRAALEKEQTHIADFAPEVAWVTKNGNSDLAEPIAIRPTSETIMYPAYAKWLRSDTELPLKLNQWSNVVRWEFKDPKPFLRTREFLWQEGHSAFATKAEADEEVLTILNLYAKVYEDLLAVPVIKGRKTEKEKFAGSNYTTTVEAFILTSGRAIQGATSHHLGQNFSKMFNIQVEGVLGGDEKTYVYQNSWGLTTRTIGVMIMVHGDDKGLVLPPNVASVQAVLVPCGITASTSMEQKHVLHAECVKLLAELTVDKTLRIKADHRNNRTPGWKFNHWEMKGVPVRIELGPKDLQNNQVTFVRRDTSERVITPRAIVLQSLHKLLNDIQLSMFTRAKTDLYEHIKQVEIWDEFCSKLNNKNLILSPFCGEIECENRIKADSAREDAGDEVGALSMGAKSLCIPFEQPQSTMSLDKLKCIHPGCSKKPKFYTLFGRSY